MKTLYKNNQWKVTSYGVESVAPAPDYHFEASRLDETTERPVGTLYDWPVHMAEKSWVDIEAFIDAFRRALQLHVGKYDRPQDDRMLAASMAYARQIARER